MKKEETAFCIACSSKKTYTVTSQLVEIAVRGIRFSYVEQTAYCDTCGEELCVPEIDDQNAQAREDAYREAAGLITVSEIREILEKYNIGAGPLAKLLGFGEITINRYLGGQLPSKIHSDKLLEVRASYVKMSEYLEMNGSSISEVAYNKCRDAINKLKDIYSNGKIETVIRYLLHKDSDITPLALQKILYYAQAFFKAMFGEPLFTDRCQAWVYGPVYPDVYYKYREFGYDPIKLHDIEFSAENSELSATETSFLDAIVSSFGCYSGKVLRNMTHSETPWLEARGNLRPKDRCTNVIDPEKINSYFKKIVEEYHMVNPCDIVRYSRYMADSLAE